MVCGICVVRGAPKRIWTAVRIGTENMDRRRAYKIVCLALVITNRSKRNGHAHNWCSTLRFELFRTGLRLLYELRRSTSGWKTNDSIAGLNDH